MKKLAGVILLGCLIVVGVASAQKKWTGLGEVANWNVPANWSDYECPGPLDTVVLDNSLCGYGYTVSLSSAAAVVRHLRITPDPEMTITLLLPNEADPDPSLFVGDSVAGTDDIVIDAGGVLQNSAPSGGSMITLAPNSTLRINDNGTYIHNTTGAHASLLGALSTAPGTEYGCIEFDVPMTSDYAISVSGITFGSLYLKNSTTYNYTSSGSGQVNVRGDFTIERATTGSYASTMTGTMHVQGHIRVDGTASMTQFGSSQIVELDGARVHAIYGTGQAYFSGGLVLRDTDGVSLSQLVVVGDTLRIGNENIITNSYSIILASGCTMSRLNGYVIGELRKTDVPSGTTYEVGTYSGYAPVIISDDNGDESWGVRAVSGNVSGRCGNNVLGMSWEVTYRGPGEVEPSGAFDLQFTYPVALVHGTEASYTPFWWNYEAWVNAGATVNTGTHTASVSGTMNQGLYTIGEPTSFPPFIDGSLSDAAYVTAATKQNTNSGFGSDADVSKIVYFPDAMNSQLYIGVVGKLPTSSADGMGLWLGFPRISGASAGTALGGVSSAGHYMEAGLYPAFKADFNVAYMFALNTGTTSANMHVNALKKVGGNSTVYLGDCGQTGSYLYGPSTTGGFWSQNSVAFAFDNSVGANTGFEMRIPFSQLGVSWTDSLYAFAFIISQDAYFSDVMVPGHITTGNPGYEPDFNTMGTGGPYHSSPLAPLPVQLTSFRAIGAGNAGLLEWTTSTETNCFGFEIERRRVAGDPPSWVIIGSVKASGTSAAPHRYSYADKDLAPGRYVYRLRQIDRGGTNKYYESSEIEILAPDKFSLNQNFPNPFNPTTTVQYALPTRTHVSLAVYNTLGQKVADLVNEEKDAGYYEVQFDASHLASGVYVYRIQAGSFIQTRKLMVVK